VKGLSATHTAVKLGAPVNRANSVGSVRRFCRRSSRSNVRARSMPARDERRLPRRLSEVMAGKGVRVSECRESIMLPDKFKARRLVKIERLSGIAVNKLLERSSEVNDPASGTNADAEMYGSALSDNDKCRKNLHFDGGNAIGFGGGKMVDAWEEWLLPEPDLRMRWDCARETAVELPLDGELLLGRLFELDRDDSE
jgi:hypothetical protein